MTVTQQNLIRNQQSESTPKVALDVEKIRRDFPILRRTIRGNPLVYLDNAATTQKPQVVIDTLSEYYKNYNANVHRGLHYLSEKSTELYQEARETVRKFLNAKHSKEIIFVRGVTEAINLIANSYGLKHIKENDEIIISTMEHHSNIVPWQLLCERTGAKLRVIPITDTGEIIVSDYETLFSERTKLVSIVHVSNALGTINPVQWMIEKAHECHVPVLVDGAQSTPHLKVDVQLLDCDFYTFSGHKMFGPTGIGVLYGKENLLDSMPPYHGGGDMIRSVTFAKTTYTGLPSKFEAGTPNIADAIGLKAAIDYISSVGINTIMAYEQKLLKYLTELLADIRGLTIIGTAKEKASVLSFVFDRNVFAPEIHPHDIGQYLNEHGIAIRVGHHCTQPLMQRFGITATSRVSLSFYNRKEELDKLAEILPNIPKFLGVRCLS